MDDFSNDSPAVRRAMVYFVLMLERVKVGLPPRLPGDRDLLPGIGSGSRGSTPS